jgi:hypothetical protein
MNHYTSLRHLLLSQWSLSFFLNLATVSLSNFISCLSIYL